MSDELSKRDIERLAEQNVGLLTNVQEAIALLQALGPVLTRAEAACKIGASNNAAKCRGVENAEADATAGTMGDAAAKFRVIAGVVEDLNRYV
jgi:hypothetical protein